jgi:hypothetical protein
LTFDFSEKRKFKTNMINYMGAMVDNFSIKYKTTDTAPTLAAEDLFAEGEGKDLDPQRAE